MELKRDEIIKALECCFVVCYCNTCPYYKVGEQTQVCTRKMAKDALSLIKELTEDVEWSAKRILEADKKVAELTEENERLRDELAKSYEALDESVNFYCSFTKSKIQNCPIDDEVAKAKADTVRKYREALYRAFAHFDSNDKFNKKVFLEAVDQIAKELIGE